MWKLIKMNEVCKDISTMENEDVHFDLTRLGKEKQNTGLIEAFLSCRASINTVVQFKAQQQ